MHIFIMWVCSVAKLIETEHYMGASFIACLWSFSLHHTCACLGCGGDSWSTVTSSEISAYHHHTKAPISLHLIHRLNRSALTRSGPNSVCWLAPRQPTNTHWSKVSHEFMKSKSWLHMFRHTLHSHSYSAFVQASSTVPFWNRGRLSQ